MNDFKELRIIVNLNIVNSYKEYIEGIEKGIQSDSQHIKKYISDKRVPSAVPKTFNPGCSFQESTLDFLAKLLHITDFVE